MKVVCSLCEFEEKGLCVKKKRTKVSLKKKRQCKLYAQSEAKVQTLVDKRLNAKPIPTTFRPEWWHDRRAYINKLKALDKEQRRRDEELDENVPVKRMPIESVKHPLTGDLSKFKSTVGKAPIKDQSGPNIKSK